MERASSLQRLPRTPQIGKLTISASGLMVSGRQVTQAQLFAGTVYFASTVLKAISEKFTHLMSRTCDSAKVLPISHTFYFLY